MSRRIYYLDLALFPAAGCNSRGNRNAAFLLIMHPVHYRFAVMNLADFVGTACIVKYPLGYCCLASVNMGYNPDISYVFNVTLLFHRIKSMFALKGKRRSM